MNQYTKYLVLKSVMENIFGADAWYALKESNHVPTWRKYAAKILNAIEFSIKDTVEIYDEEWLNQIQHEIQRGLEAMKHSEAIDEIIAVLAGVLINVSFLQIGFMPKRSGTQTKFSLRKGNWKFNAYRSVIYLQSKEQKENQFLSSQKILIGFEEQQNLLSEHFRSKSKLPFSEWCTSQKKA
jgi:hypothetical protein